MGDLRSRAALAAIALTPFAMGCTSDNGTGQSPVDASSNVVDATTDTGSQAADATNDAPSAPDVNATDASATDASDAAPEDTGAPDATCDGTCLLVINSGTDWPSSAGRVPDGGTVEAGVADGGALGPAKDVCLNANSPANCPSDAVLYNFGSGWTAASSIPDAHWIWRGDVTPNGASDLVVAVFERTFDVGASPSGSIQMTADDYVEVRVNDTFVGSVGSVTTPTSAPLTTFDLSARLHAGPNTITVIAQNGPASFAGGCGGACTYAQNPAGVVFRIVLQWAP
jgi:hypothetical protein